MDYTEILFIIGAYFLGSIPTAFLAGKLIRGIDLREYGSGTISGSMVWEHVAKWAIFPVGIFDLCKAAFPTWLGLELGFGIEIAVAAGFAASIGHNWPVFLRFIGGRGLGEFLGMLAVIFPWGAPWLLSFLTFGYLMGDSAPYAIVSLSLLPMFNAWMNGPEIINIATIVMIAITVLKRLEANRRPLPKDWKKRKEVINLRIFFDRDIPSHQEWIDRNR